VRTLATAALAALCFAAMSGVAAAGRDPAAAKAERALGHAEGLFRGRPAGARRPEPTLALRDLASRFGQLSPAGKARASALLDRPTTPGNPRGYTVPSTFVCSNVCLHWVETSADAPPPRDAHGDRLPDQVEATLAVLDQIWAKEIVEFGFRPPRSDDVLRDHGPDGRLDVYLADIADDVLGYCSPEVPRDYTWFDVPGHCVLDNDYSPAQLGPPNSSGLLALERNAAHEFFHVVQFAYDFNEDGWLMEGTATWMEDEVFDSISGSYGWFPYTALRHPEVPIDTFSRFQPFQYGSWLFWRFLEELFSPANGPRAPAVIRRVWEWADGSPGAPDLYSLQAVDATARERGLTARGVFSLFGVANVIPRAFYRDGATYPSAPRAASFTLSSRRPSTGRRQVTLNHLTNASIELRPGVGVGRGARLHVAVDAPPRERGSEASVIVTARSGRHDATPLRLSAAGDANVSVPFGRGTTARVVLVLTNASTRFRCGRRTLLSCSGQPLDDGQRFRYRVALA
jgi:hypothetical protein